MKKNIHPKYFSKAKINCACGNNFTVGSTKETMEIEICGLCHPFYSHKNKIVDTAGIVDKFKKRLEKSRTMKKTAAEKNKKEKESKK